MSNSIVLGDLGGHEIVLDFEGRLLTLGFFAGAAQGESNTAANVGAGAGVFRDKTGATVNLRSVTGSGAVAVTEGADEIDINVAAGGGDVVGPVGSTDNAPAIFDGVTGKLIKGPDAAVDYLGQAIGNVGLVDGRGVSADGAVLDGHVVDTANPHSTDVGNLGTGTLAELNTAVTDATLDDSSDARPPAAHSATHADGGADEIDAGALGSGVAGSGDVLTADGIGGNAYQTIVTTDELVGVTGADTTPGLLDDKLLPGDGLTRTIVTPGGNEDLRLDVALTADGQHGNRGGGALHADAVALGASGFISGADQSKLDGVAAGAQPNQTVTAGDGLTGGGAGAAITVDVAANADGSIVVNADDVQVGILASDAQHGSRGGGTQHIEVVAGGASGFMDGADKTKLNGISAGAQPGDVVGPGPTVVDNALARFDGTGGLTIQEGSVELSDTGDVLPAADDAQDMGSAAVRWAEIRSRLLLGTQGNGTVSVPASGQGGALLGQATQTGTGSATLAFGTTAPFPPIIMAANAVAGNTTTAFASHQAGGGSMFGSAYVSAGNSNIGELLSTNTAYGSFTGGYVWSHGSGSTGRVRNNGGGSFLWCYINKTGAGTSLAETTGAGAFAVGRIEGAGTHTLRGSGGGSFTQGLLLGNTGSSRIEGGGAGSFAQGRANTGGTIRATNRGSFAQGNTDGNAILASGHGSFAQGSAATGTITASATNAVQFGPGTNALADSLQVGGAGLRLKGTAGAPATPQNGDQWVSGGFVYIRSNGVSVQIT